MPAFDFPPLILMTAFDGDFARFNTAVYEIFVRDFVKTKPTFEGRRLGLKKHPIIDGKEYTYYHFTHDGRVEEERLPNIRRMERICYPRPLIDNSDHPDFKVWRNTRQAGKNRICIYCERERYLVVLDDRQEYILPWTAYMVDNDHTHRKLLKEYNEYINAEAAQGN